MGLLGELKKTIDATESHLWSNYQAEGRIHGACAGRAIETALTVELLKGMKGMDVQSEKLISFCVKYLNEMSEQDSSKNEVYNEISRFIVSAVLSDRAEVDPSGNFEHVLRQFHHPSRQRKHVLFSVLLAEMGVLSFENLEFSQRSFDYPNNQSWTSLVMIAVKVLYGLSTNVFTVSDEELNCLVDSQSEDGSWDCHMFAGLIILIALKKTGRFSSTIEKGIICSRRDRVKHPGAMADYIRKAQLQDGGWGFRKGLTASDVDDTSLCVLFLQLVDSTNSREVVANGFKAILDSQNPDGGFTTYVRGAPSEVEVTAHVIMSLATEQKKHASSIERACGWLESAQATDGSFRSEWVDTSLYSVSQVLFAINSLSDRSASVDAMALRGSQFLLKQQNSDGGWGNSPGSQSAALSTSYALIGLLSFETIASSNSVVRGIRFLLSQQSESGSFVSIPDALGPRPFVYEIKLFATIYALWALYELEAKLVQLPEVE